MLRVVIDTNIWISAALSQAGAPARLVDWVLAHGRPVFSQATFAELELRLWRPKFDRYLSMEFRQRILHDVNTASMWVDELATATEKYCRDSDDDKFIYTALAAEAPWLVTGDRDLLDIPAIANLRILSPTDALKLPAFRL